MTVFWIVAALLLVAALLFMLPPLLLPGKRHEDDVRRDKINIAIHNDKVAELDADLRNGVLTDEQFDSARKELDRNLLEDVKDHEESSSGTAAKSSTVAIILGIGIPVMAVLMYNQLGAGLAGISPNDPSVKVSAEGHEEPIENMIIGLKQRLASNPQDVEGWVMLGRSYYFQKRHLEASKAYGEAVKLSGENNPDLLADLADTLAVANNRTMAGRPYELVQKALSLQPFHQKSLWLAGTGAYQAEDFPSALSYWEKLIAIFPPESDSAQQIQRNIGEVKELMASRGIPIPESSVAAVSNSASAAAAPVALSTALPGANSVSGVVSIASVFASSAAPTDTVFIFARAATGPRMPLAILRKQVKDLPITFVLDDSLSMNPAFKLSKFKDIIVGARVSKSGNAMPQSGDFEGKSPVISVGTTEIPLLINTVRP